MRVLLLWKQLASHTSACFRALAAAGASVRVVHRAATPDAPYDDAWLTEGLDAEAWEHGIDDSAVQTELERFQPDVVVTCSWDVGAYRRGARRWRGRAVRVLCMDNAWLGTAKQWSGRAVSRFAIRPSYDVAFLPGARQAVFARMLGFGDDEILWGLYCCDVPRFSTSGEPGRAGDFLFAGRLVEEKAVDVLADAYRRYRDTVDVSAWGLTVVGTGPLEHLVRAHPGVNALGFVHPDALPKQFANAGCLVLPSRFEPWGVVVHEAAAAGLPVICSSACGASTRLVLDGFNGRVVPPGDVDALARAMGWISDLPFERRAELSLASRSLAQQFTPSRWAEYLLDRCAEARDRYVDGAPRG